MKLIDLEIDSETTPYFSPGTTEEICSCSPVVDSPYLDWDPGISERFRTGAEFLDPTRKEQEGFAREAD